MAEKGEMCSRYQINLPSMNVRLLGFIICWHKNIQFKDRIVTVRLYFLSWRVITSSHLISLDISQHKQDWFELQIHAASLPQNVIKAIRPEHQK
jgi:hypothetical protein